MSDSEELPFAGYPMSKRAIGPNGWAEGTRGETANDRMYVRFLSLSLQSLPLRHGAGENKQCVSSSHGSWSVRDNPCPPRRKATTHGKLAHSGIERFAVVKTILLTLCATLLVSIVPAEAEIVYPDLAPGSSFRFVFLTSGTTSADSPYISSYNNFAADHAPYVTTEVDQPMWRAIASTIFTAAKDNITMGSSGNLPIYNTAGEYVAADDAYLWGGVPLMNSINYDENGNRMDDGQVWTGTAANGNAGGYPLRAYTASYGNPQAIDSLWVQVGASPSNIRMPVYAISSEIVMVPEPATLSLLSLLALSGLVLQCRGGRARQ